MAVAGPTTPWNLAVWSIEWSHWKLDTILSVTMGVMFLITTMLILIAVYRIHKKDGPPTLPDLITSVDKTGTCRFDARKCWEAGAFYASTWAFIYLTFGGKLTEWFFMTYMASWVAARFLRDRERRLANGADHENGSAPSLQPQAEMPVIDGAGEDKTPRPLYPKQ